VFLTWLDNSANESGFEIHRSADGIGFNRVALLGANAVNWADADLASGTYTYRVRAYNSGGISAWSNLGSVVVN
jgi:hypothetical protein